MSYQIDDIDLSARLSELNLELPTSVAFFPENLDTANSPAEFVFSDSLIDLNKVLRKNDLSIPPFGSNAESTRSRKNADIYIPAIFFSASVLSENPSVVSLSLNIVSNYLTDFFKGRLGPKKANTEFYIETKEKGKVKKISYSGPVEGMKEIVDIIKNMK
jgi:hypothetical protein